MALSEQERLDMVAYQRLLGELEDEDPAFLKKGAKPTPKAETRPFLHNTGPDLEGQFKADVAALTPDRDLTGTQDSPVRKFSPYEYGKPGNQFVGPPEQESRDFLRFAGSMATPELVVAGGNRLLTGAVARSAAREPGAVGEAVKGIGRAATSNIPGQAVAAAAGHTIGIPPWLIPVAKATPAAARAGGLMADEGLAAAGRAIGIKPYSPVNYAVPRVSGEVVPSPPMPTPPRPVIDVAPIPQGQLGGSPARRQLGPAPIPLGPMSDTGGIPRAIEAEMTTPIPRQPMRDIVPAARGEGVDLAAEQARKAALPDDVASLDKTQRIAAPGPSPSTVGEKPISPRMQAYRDSLKAAEEERFAKKMGKSVEEYRALLNLRQQRVPQSLQKFQQTGDEASLRKDLTDAIFEDDGL